MLNLDSKIQLNRDAVQSPNLCDRFSPEDLVKIGSACKQGYEADEFSRRKWLERNEAGMDLALQITKDKSFPWAGCSNVAFPLVSIAAQQFHARAYPALIQGPKLVKYDVFGPDPDGQKNARAEQVASKMSWQLLHQDKEWEEQEDKGILNVSIVGTIFKKTYYRHQENYNCSELVLAKNLVLDYWAKSVECCPRKTHIIPTFSNEIYENVMKGLWREEILEQGWYIRPSPPQLTRAQQEQNSRQGVTPPPFDPDFATFMMLEQHVNLDLDGDGYKEPYIITLDKNTGFITRIVTRFDDETKIERVALGSNKGKIIRIEANEYFTKKSFIPSPDGGIYDLGFGLFLGPLNEAVNSLINMLVDSGVLQTTSGGFLGRGVKIRGGATSFGPFEWKRVDSTGDDLRKSIFQLPVNEPSAVLFQLLSLLITYSSRLSGTTDTQVGENPGQNTPAQSMQTMVEMGQKLYSAIFKRIWRGTKEEYQKLYKLNSIHLPVGERELFSGKGDEIRPAADPNATTQNMRLQIATTVKQAAATTPGYDKDAVEMYWLSALQVEDAQRLYTGTKGTPPPEDPKITVAKMKEEGLTQRLQMQLQDDGQKFVAQLQADMIVNNAKVIELQAKAQESAANAQSEAAYAQVALLNAEIARLKESNIHIKNQIDATLRHLEIMSNHAISMREAAAKASKTETA